MRLRHAQTYPRLRMALALLALAAVVLFFQRGVVAHLADSVDNGGDPLLNAWIVSWNLHALRTAPASLWHANIFYPHQYTLAYSENLIVPSLLVMPAAVFSDNPVLLYNLSFLIGCLLSAAAAYLLARALTRSHLLGIALGAAFACGPFRLAHGGHMQIQHGQWMVLGILFTVQYFSGARRVAPRRVRLAAAGAALLLQFLSNMYYFMFAAPVLALLQGFGLWRLAPGRRRTAAVELAAFWVLLAAATLPFARPYLIVRGELEMVRDAGTVQKLSATPRDYANYDSGNVWFGRFARRGSGVEHRLCPGALIAAAALLPVLLPVLRRGPSFLRRRAADWRAQPLAAAIDVLIVLAAALAVVTLFGGGMECGLCTEPLRISVTRPGRPALALVALVALRVWLLRRRPAIRRGGFSRGGRGESIQAFSEGNAPAAGNKQHRLARGERDGVRGQEWTAAFLCAAAFAVLMSFGPERGPYGFFYRFVPGYDGLRVPARFAGLVAPLLAAAAVLNVAALSRRMRLPAARAALCALFAAGVIGEYWSRPRPMQYRPGRRPVYDWLAAAPDGPVVELPLPRSPHDIGRDAIYEFHSTRHWKPLFNGYSGHAPPGYHAAARIMAGFPSDAALARMRRLGIRYVLAHRCGHAMREACAGRVTLAARFGTDCVFDLLASEGTESVR